MTDIVTITLNPAVDLSTAVDKIMPVAKLRGKSQRRDPGGGGINVDARRSLRAPPIPITPRSALAAGDSFLAALVWRLASDDSAQTLFASRSLPAPRPCSIPARNYAGRTTSRASPVK
ncbi:hypothetical protein RX328_42080 [Bradyrhizobium sp. sBnM-33]|nr:hypothetical protein [Bradyrhizobium sp. sBnM-33]WOH50530.1 hypothetical protein RX328_42080 [Bradyrhizobium sp. sBnM-33]